MKDWSWLTPLGYILAALVAGGFLLWNSRKSPHDVLKTMVEIHKDLPDSEARTALLAQIEERVSALTARTGDTPETESPIEIEFRDGRDLQRRVALAVTFVSAFASFLIGAVALIHSFY